MMHNLHHNVNEREYKGYFSKKRINNFQQEKIYNEDHVKDFNLHENCQNIFNRMEDIYPSNTINSSEIYRTINYSFSELKNRSKCFKKEDIMKRAHFYFSLFYKLNCSEIEKVYNYNKNYNNLFFLKFSNIDFPIRIKKTKQENSNDIYDSKNEDNTLAKNIDVKETYKEYNNSIPSLNIFDDDNEKKELSEKKNNGEKVLIKTALSILSGKREKIKSKHSHINKKINEYNKKDEEKEINQNQDVKFINQKRKLEKIEEVADEENEEENKYKKIRSEKNKKLEIVDKNNNGTKNTLNKENNKKDKSKKTKKTKKSKKNNSIQKSSCLELDEMKEEEKLINNSEEYNNNCINKNNVIEKINDDIQTNNFNIFDEKNMPFFNNDLFSSNSVKNTESNNSVNEEETKYSDNKQSEKAFIKQMKDEDFIDVENDLRDYLRKTISEKRQEKFFRKILPESLEYVKQLFMKGNKLVVDSIIPIYRNEYLELALALQKGGIIKKRISIIK